MRTRLGPLLLALIETGSVQAVQTLQPIVYQSDSGRYSVLVDPSQRYGAGPARYRFDERGQVRWSRDLPFTLWHAVVGDDGTIAGYGYSTGIHGGRPGDEDTLILAVLSADGRLVVEQRLVRKEGRSFHSLPEPTAVGGWLDPLLQTLVLRMQGAEPGVDEEQWWQMRLADGKVHDRVDPGRSMPAPKTLRAVMAALPLPQTPLTLVQWDRFEQRVEWTCSSGLPPQSSGMASSRAGTTFALLDAQFAPVWILDLPDDYTFDEDDHLSRRLRTWLEWRQDRGVLAVAERRFEVLSVTTRQRLVFEVTADPGLDTGWQVRPVASTPFFPAQVARSGDFDRIPLQNIAPIGRIELPTRFTMAKTAITEAELERQGHIDFATCEDARAVFCLVDGFEPLEIDALTVNRVGEAVAVDSRSGSVWVFGANGQRLRTCVADPLDDSYSAEPQSLSFADTGSVLVARRERPVDFLQYEADCTSFVLDGLPEFDADQRWHLQPDGHNRWVLANHLLLRVDDRGQVLQSIERDGNGHWLEDPGPAAVGPNGSIALITGAVLPSRSDPSPPKLALYSRTGEALATWALPDGVSRFRQFGYDGVMFAFVLDDEEKAGAESVVIITNHLGTPLARLHVAREVFDAFLTQVDGERELWLRHEHHVDRYPLTELGAP